MSQSFFEAPVLNSPYERPSRHWQLDDDLQPTTQTVQQRRPASYITPVPRPKRSGGQSEQRSLVLDEGRGLSSESQAYDPTSTINDVRAFVQGWRESPESEWQVTPETARLLKHWRHHQFSDLRPFFCQIEAVETVIWLTEVAPRMRRGSPERELLERLRRASEDANPGLERLALKLATGAGKTTVMAMLIAWQTVNAVRRPNSRNFTRGFLVVTPGITIRDRLRVLMPNDPESYYESRELVPSDMLSDLQRARIVITNYHAFKLRDTMQLSSGARDLLRGRGPALRSTESEGQMLQRVMPELMGMRSILAFNDEAHHCYREKPGEDDEGKLSGDDLQEAKKNTEAARLWISGLEAVERRLGLRRVIDLSATPFFLRGSGYAEGTLFPWTMSDFSLMDAIECGIVKLPRVPVADNIPGADMPIYRTLWENIRTSMPKKGRGKAASLDPQSLPTYLTTALQVLYGHYEQTFRLWQEAGTAARPCFIVVCNNTSTSKLVYDYISGFTRETEDGQTNVVHGRFKLFDNFDELDNRYPMPRTLLIDSQQLESGDGLDRAFRDVAKDEIEQLKRDRVHRSGNPADAENISDDVLLREVMNSVGKAGELGESIRCVVSVSMLTEGWDANNVTHILGVRAFGTQLLCEQVVGRALRRLSYDLNEEGLLDVEYADVLGIPFDFTAKPVVAPPTPPRPTRQVRAVREREALEIRFPRVEGYRVELPDERLEAEFSDDSTLVLTPELVGPTITRNEPIIGEGVDLTLIHTQELRFSSLVMNLTRRLLETKFRDADGEPKLHLYGSLKRITREWLANHLVCQGGAYPAQLMYQELADRACDRIMAGIASSSVGERPIQAVLDPYNPLGSTRHVSFVTSKQQPWETDPRKCHVNLAVCDSDWEAEFCRVAEAHPRVHSYVKNQGLGLEVPYRSGAATRRYIPDFIVCVDDGHGPEDLLNLIVEVKGFRGEDVKDKSATMEAYWVPAVNRLGAYGRWAFVELGQLYTMREEFDQAIAGAIGEPASAAG